MAETTCTKQQALQSEYATRDHGNTKKLTVPQLAYRPVRPKWYRPRIGLIACGGITKVHLSAYENAGYDVVAFADPVIENALDKRDTYYPNADVYDHADAIFKRDDIDVVDAIIDLSFFFSFAASPPTLQSLVPLLVVSKLSKVRKPSLFTPTPKTFVKSVSSWPQVV